MLRDYKGKVTVKIDGYAATAATVIAMAGDTVLVSPVSMMVIHNPSTVVMGDHVEMEKAIEMLFEVKNSIINAYQLKTGMSCRKLSQLMDNETCMNARMALDLRFADGLIKREWNGDDMPETVSFALKPYQQRVTNRIRRMCSVSDDTAKETKQLVSTADLYERLKTIKEKF